MADLKKVHAPYNFVPFSNKLLMPYASASELPGHDGIGRDLLSGELQITMTAETPVFVSDGGKTADRKSKELHFFRLPNGEYAIPGSTIRGMTRENMQILGFGLVRPGQDLEDYRIYFRNMASPKEAIGNNVKQYYHEVLGIQSRRSPESGKNYSLAENVRSGYLYKKSGKYLIYPTIEPYFRVSRKHSDVQQFGRGDARVIPVAFTAGADRVKTIMSAADAGKDMRQGMLLYTGWPVGQPNHLYLFPEADETAEPVELSREDVLSYEEDLEARRNTLKGSSFWNLPRNGERKPVFYLRHDGHTYFGMSQFLRIGYPHALSEGLPARHRAELDKDETPLDYPHAILGFANDQQAFRSRVSFGDFAADPGTKENGPVPMILGNPKPGYYPGYVRDGKDYTEDHFELRGYKQYWFKDVVETQVPEGKERVRTTIHPLPEGTVFRGTVRFRNLTEVELGLLLWSLRLEDGCCQAVGMGKPYGYGRMRLAIDRLALLDHQALYGRDLTACAYWDATDRISDLILAYDAAAAEKLNIKKPAERPSVTSRSEIQDFFFMKKAILSGEETSYMDLGVYTKVRTPLPTVEEFRKRAEKQQEPATEDPFEALKKKFGSVL